MPQTAFVTGGAGFIGGHLVDRLMEEGWTVKVYDNMVCGHASNLARHKSNPRLQIHEGDVRDSKMIKKLSMGCDAIFHMAAHANIRTSLEDHMADLENNLIGTLNILEAMTENRIEDLVFASTSAIYGEARQIPTSEDYSPVQTSLYGASKLACEAYAEAYTKLAPIKVWAFRFANVVGERCRRGVVWDFTHKLERNSRVLEILGDGKQSKEYLYVKDCVDGILTGYSKKHEAVNIFNLGIEEQTIVDRVADLVIEEMRLTNVRKSYTGGIRGWIGDNPLVQLSLDKIKSLGWSPKVSSEEALRRTARWVMGTLKD